MIKSLYLIVGVLTIMLVLNNKDILTRKQLKKKIFDNEYTTKLISSDL